MKTPLFLILIALHLLSQSGEAAPSLIRSWSFESMVLDRLHPRGNGFLQLGAGVEGSCGLLEGRTLLEAEDSALLANMESPFTLVAWCNPHAPGLGQQMIAARNQYSLNRREWGVMIDKDGRFRLYVWQGHWETVTSDLIPQAGHWYQVAVRSEGNRITLLVNGVSAGTLALEKPVPPTGASLTLGSVLDPQQIRQGFVGGLDEVRLYGEALPDTKIQSLYVPATSTHAVHRRLPVSQPEPDEGWNAMAVVHAQEDQSRLVFDGRAPDSLACDTTLREMPDGSWVMVMLGGGHTEPLPENRVFLTRSLDRGETWSPLTPLDLGIKSRDPSMALVPSELMVHQGRCTLFVATHDGTFADWKEWMTHSLDSGQTWSALEPAPGRLKDRTFIRNHIVTRDGRILLPYQHYLSVAETRTISNQRRFSAPTNPRNGVLMSEDGGKTWTVHGDIRISSDDRYHGWAENNIVELSDGRIAMIIRADKLGGVLYYAESNDGGRTWPPFARPTGIPNPGSKATLYGLGGDHVALLHNPNPNHRSPLSLWVSFDGMRSWPYQRVLVPESVDGPKGRLNYPDGFVDLEKGRLHFAFDDNRHRAVVMSVSLPQPPETPGIWKGKEPVSDAGQLPVLSGVGFHVIQPWEPEVNGHPWLHGVALAWFHGKLYASFGWNEGAENTHTEEAAYRVSEDGGKTWSPVRLIDPGLDEEDLAVSHGVFHVHQDRLWAYLGAFHGTRQKVHTRAYVLDETTGLWEPKDTVLQGGFWPMGRPVSLEPDHWILPGFVVGEDNPPAVAHLTGQDRELLGWEMKKLTPGPGVGRVWGESAVIADSKGLLNLARYGEKAVALASSSRDQGRTWSPFLPSNLPMATSKPTAGVLSTGQRFLICSTSGDGGSRRSPLTLALSRPGEEAFSEVWVIRHAEFPEGPGESHAKASLAYPDAVEHEGNLYVAYSNSGGRGRNHNSAELAVIPLTSLEESEPQWVPLSDGQSFEGWEQGGNWEVRDGAFHRISRGGSLTYTNALVPDDFELVFEWKVSEGCNSGVYYRPAQYEYQVLDNVGSPYGENPRQAAASLFFCMAPSSDATRSVGEWNEGRVRCKGSVIEHWLNGRRVISFDYKDPRWAEQVRLLKIRGADLDARGGRLWLQDHGQEVWFRNLKWREVPKEELVVADPHFVPLPVTGVALEKENARVRRMLESAQ